MNRRYFIKTLSAALGATATHATSQSTSEFDFIIVGAGSAGCVVASRLSADPKSRVLLLEAGTPNSSDPAITTPGRWVSLIGSAFDWGYTTESEPGLGDRRLTFPRGKVIGGSSAINAMAFIRGHRLDFQRWEREGNTGWGYDDVLPVFRRIEDNSRGTSQYRSAGGPLRVSDCVDPNAGHAAFLAAAGELGYKADAEWDFNGPDPENAAGYYQKNIKDGRRHSAAAAFLLPVLSRPNLHVLTQALATRLVIEGNRAVGIEYARDGRREQVRAAREIILCGGVIDTPKLLMLSGIGPADHLRAHRIPVALDLPGVGSNLQDHLKLSIRWNGRTTLPPSTVTAGMFVRSRHATRDAPAEAPAGSTAPGAPAAPVAPAAPAAPAALAAPAAPEAPEVPEAPDLQFYVGRGVDQPDRFVTITVSLVRPRSRGEVRLRSTDPLAAPLIRGNYLSESSDVDALVEGVRLTRALGNARAYDALRADEVEPGAAVVSHAAVTEFARRACDTIYHPAGTCHMGNDSRSVVDARLRVRGIEGLRIADASVMPDVVSATTHATCVMIGDRAADFVLA